jgi:hypothetical protein
MFVFGALIEEVRFAVDSPLEQTGFELSVPARTGKVRTRWPDWVLSGRGVNREIRRRCGRTRPVTPPGS